MTKLAVNMNNLACNVPVHIISHDHSVCRPIGSSNNGTMSWLVSNNSGDYQLRHQPDIDANDKATKRVSKMSINSAYARNPFLYLIAIAATIMTFDGEILSGSCSGLKMSISLPELVRVNDAFWLNCSHNSMKNNQNEIRNQSNAMLYDDAREINTSETTRTPGDIYAIKWFKDDDLFYRFLPNSPSPQSVFYETQGIQIDVSRVGQFKFLSFE